MNILHISRCDFLGGSARSAHRIHSSLKKFGAVSRMLVSIKTTRENEISNINNRFTRTLDRISNRIFENFSLQYFFYPSSFILSTHNWFKEADIVQLYNIHGDYFCYTALPFLSKRKPIVWRLSDMWPLTGHCSYSYECDFWKNSCGNCPYLSEYPSLKRDTTSLLWKIKNFVYAHSNITIVAPSNWMMDLAKKSPLLNRFQIHFIPNGIDIETFKPIKKKNARKILGIENSKQVILFCADSVLEKRKGYDLLKKALLAIPDDLQKNITLLIVGNLTKKIDLPLKHKYIDYVHDEITMSLIYSAADIFLHPALADNLPNTIIESMACGTPVVAFDAGGVRDAVRHMQTGYLASYNDIVDFATGIITLLEKDELRLEVSQKCREVAEAEYNSDLQAKRYVDLYANLIKK